MVFLIPLVFCLWLGLFLTMFLSGREIHPLLRLPRGFWPFLLRLLNRSLLETYGWLPRPLSVVRSGLPARLQIDLYSLFKRFACLLALLVSASFPFSLATCMPRKFSIDERKLSWLALQRCNLPSSSFASVMPSLMGRNIFFLKRQKDPFKDLSAPLDHFALLLSHFP